MRENDYSKADMFAKVVSDLRKEKKIKVISNKAVENYYNQTTKPDARTIGAIKGLRLEKKINPHPTIIISMKKLATTTIVVMGK